jgi:hypothetical protein
MPGIIESGPRGYTATAAMHLEFSYTFEDYREANQAHMRRVSAGGPARFAVLGLVVCIIGVGAYALLQATRSTPAATPPAPGVAGGGGGGGGSSSSSPILDVTLPMLPWLFLFAFLWFFVMRRMSPRKPRSFLYASSLDAERDGRPRRRGYVISAVIVIAGLLLLVTNVYLDHARDAHAAGNEVHLSDAAFSMGPWVLIFLVVWILVFRAIRRQTRRNWEGQPNVQLEYRMDVSPQGISVANPVSSSAYRWEAFQRVLETPNMFILFLSTLTFVLIPKRALPDGHGVDELRGMLRTMIAERPAPAFAVLFPPPQ